MTIMDSTPLSRESDTPFILLITAGMVLESGLADMVDTAENEVS